MGNSTALDGINTELISSEIGSAYNFSLSGANLNTSYTQLDRYLEKNHKPKKILLFLSSCHTNYKNDSGLHPVEDYAYNGFSFSKGLGDLPLFKFRWLFLENFKKLISKDHRSARLVQGQLRINRVVQDNSSYSKTVNNCIDSGMYLHDRYPYLDSIIYLSVKNKIDLDILEMPCWKERQNDCPDLELTYEGNEIAIYNLNNELRCKDVLNPNTDWLSADHLNQSGGNKLTKEVIDLISQY